MPSVFTLSGPKKAKPRKPGRRLDTTLPPPTPAQIRANRGPFAADIERIFRARGWPVKWRDGLDGAGKKTCYVVTMPPTRDVGSYKTRSCKPRREVPADALWDYNSARRHDGLPPVKRLPAGTKIRKE